MLVAVRHGRTAWNAEGRFQGWADVPLDDEGRAQSERVATALSALLGDRSGDREPARRPSPLTLASSDLLRAAGTAEAIGRALGMTVSVDRALREVDVGRWEGLTSAEVEQRFPAEYRAWSSGRDIRRGGGETLADAGRRVAGAVRSLLESAPGDVVVVGHGMSLQAALEILSREGVVDLDGAAPHLGNAEHLALQDWRHDQNERLLSER